MLNRLLIKNFVIIDEIDLNFSSGLCCITGETGSGKSLILDAIEFCLNGTGKIDLIINGASYTQVVMSFEVNKQIVELLESYDIYIEDDEISISRTLTIEGKKRCLLNNQPITQKILDQFSANLIAIYAQHSLSSLFKHQYHLKFLDFFVDNKTLINEVALSYKTIRSLENSIEELKNQNLQTSREIEYLRFARDEIKEVNPQENEEEELADKRLNLQNLAKKSEVIKDVVDTLSSSKIEETVSSLIRTLARQQNEMFANIISELDIASNSLGNASYELEKLCDTEYSEENLDMIEERLFKIKALARKYNCSSNGLVEIMNDADQKIENLEISTSEIEKITKKITQEKERYLKLSLELSRERIKQAALVEKMVKSELAHLHMASCEFKVQIESSPLHLSENGMDKAIFVASTNPGSSPAPIDKIASGGEMARFMLALQIVFLQRSNFLPMIIFDEIDTGIGGKVADSVGERLKRLSTCCRVMVITHQPQVASKADYNILVQKAINDGKTFSSASTLNQEQALREVARMLSGKVITEEALNAAKGLIPSSVQNNPN